MPVDEVLGHGGGSGWRVTSRSVLEAGRAAAELRACGFGDCDLLLVLGSGGDKWRRFLAASNVVPIAHISGFVAPTAEGHGGRSGVRRRTPARAGDHRATHLYEGHGVDAVAHAVRTAAALGCRQAIFTNANGSFRRDGRR
jgi:purine-nucleoside phosphorylase